MNNSVINTIIVIMHPLLFFFMLMEIFFIFGHIKKKRFITKRYNRLYEKIAEAEQSRVQKNNMEQSMYGELNGNRIIDHIDEVIRYSGIKTKISFISVESYILLVVLLMAVAAFLGYLFTRRWIVSVICIFGIVIFLEMLLNKMRKRRYELIEEELLAFINSVDNYASTSDDIIDILEKSALMLSGPLKEEVFEATSKAKNQGKTSEVLRKLEYRIEHPFFKTFIRNLEISSRNSANYRQIVIMERDMLQVHLENAKELKNIYDNLKFNLLMVTICGLVSIMLSITFIIHQNLGMFISNMCQSPIGRIILFFSMISYGISIYCAFIKE